MDESAVEDEASELNQIVSDVMMTLMMVSMMMKMMTMMMIDDAYFDDVDNYGDDDAFSCTSYHAVTCRRIDHHHRLVTC